MIKRNDESGNEPQRKTFRTFKTFSEFSEEGPSTSIRPDQDFDRPGNPNIPYKSNRVESPMSTNYMMPLGQDAGEFDDSEQDLSNKTKSSEPSEIPTPAANTIGDEKTNEVKFYGKVAKLPKGTKASKGFNFLENVKVSKSSIWYIMVEKQDNELQMVKYNHMKGVNLSKFVNELKTYYKSRYTSNPKVIKMIESISVDGNDKFSCIKNIPLVELDGKKMISKITEDLIRLLSK